MQTKQKTEKKRNKKEEKAKENRIKHEFKQMINEFQQKSRITNYVCQMVINKFAPILEYLKMAR